MNSVVDGMHLLEMHFGLPIDVIVRSPRTEFCASVFSAKDEGARVLSRLLGIRYTILATKVLYDDREDLRREATRAVDQSLVFDRDLNFTLTLAHDLRWKAILAASSIEPDIRSADKSLAESRELFARDSVGAAYLARDSGIVNCHIERYAKATADLSEAVDRLTSLADSRALGPTYVALTRVALQTGADERQSRRYALAGAALHPHGFVLRNTMNHIRNAGEAGLRRDLENLISAHRPFEALAPVLSRLAEASSTTLAKLLTQNISRVLPTFKPEDYGLK